MSGLSIDFQVLNFLGFGCYAAYNVALYFVPFIQSEYRHVYGENIPVGAEDVVFAVHAMLVTALTLAQCVVYDRGGQKFCTLLGRTAGITAVFILVATAVVTVSERFDVGSPSLSWLNLLLALSAVKLVVSLIKYIPQVCLLSSCAEGRCRGVCGSTSGHPCATCAGSTQLSAQVHCGLEHHQCASGLHGRQHVASAAADAVLGAE